jgi:hypothetical protein
MSLKTSMISANLQLYTQGELLAMLKRMFTSIKALDCSNRRTQIAPCMIAKHCIEKAANKKLSFIQYLIRNSIPVMKNF